MKDKLVEQAKHEYSPKQRLVFLVCLAPIFLFLLPYLFMGLGARIDEWLQLPPIPAQPFNWILGGMLSVPGLAFAMWSIYSQFTIGRGTPVPLIATQELVVQPPFTYCRNPMTLGTMGMYLGVAVFFQSTGGAVVVALFSGLLLVYIKRVEEVEMALRFGESYLAYKKRTPFLVPRFSSRAGERRSEE